MKENTKTMARGGGGRMDFERDSSSPTPPPCNTHQLWNVGGLLFCGNCISSRRYTEGTFSASFFVVFMAFKRDMFITFFSVTSTFCRIFQLYTPLSKFQSPYHYTIYVVFFSHLERLRQLVLWFLQDNKRLLNFYGALPI